MQDENTKRSGARLTSLLTVFAVLVCMLSLMILPASAASEPTADSFYGKWTVTEKAISGAAIPSEDFNFDGYFLIDGQLYHEIWFDNGGFHIYNVNSGESTFPYWMDLFVLDFGSSPVEIPKNFYDFLLENFEYSPSSYAAITANGPQNYTLLDGASSLFRMVTGSISNIGQTIMDTPLLLAFIALPVVGLGVGLFKRLRGV